MSDPQQPFISKSTKITLGIAVGMAVLLLALSSIGIVRYAENYRPPTSNVATLSPQEHLDQAKDLAAKKSYGEAKKHIDAIPSGAPEYKEAQKFWQGFKSNYMKEEGAKAIQARIDFADEAEKHFLKSNFDVYVTVSGPDKTTIQFKYVLMSRPTVYNIMNESNFSQRLRDKGFKRVIFTDGYNETWEYGL